MLDDQKSQMIRTGFGKFQRRESISVLAVTICSHYDGPVIPLSCIHICLIGPGAGTKDAFNQGDDVHEKFQGDSNPHATELR